MEGRTSGSPRAGHVGAVTSTTPRDRARPDDPVDLTCGQKGAGRTAGRVSCHERLAPSWESRTPRSGVTLCHGRLTPSVGHAARQVTPDLGDRNPHTFTILHLLWAAALGSAHLGSPRPVSPVCREGGGRGSVSSDGLADDESASKPHGCWQDSVSRRWPLTSGRPQLCGLFQHGGSFRPRVQAKKVTTESLREGGRPDILKPSPLPYSVSQKYFSGPGRTGGDGHPRER